MPYKNSNHPRRRTYVSWKGMMYRCEKPATRQHRDYGGRGLTVCDRWKVFENFIEDMGYRPAGLTLERVDNERGYAQDNCRWATRHDQARNRRNTIIVTHDGREMCLTDACSSDAHYQAILRRMRRGMSFADALADRGHN